MDKYRVSVLTGVNQTEFMTLNKRQPIDRQVLVKVEACALCTLEQRVYDGVRKMYPFAGGHEVSGVVESVGENVKNFNIGDKVVIRTLNTCGECYYCRSGHENQCVVSYQASIHEGLRGPGGLSEYMLVEAKNVYRVSNEVDLIHASLTEPLACCIHSVNKAKINFADDVVVVGVGIMGAFHIQLAKLRGARVIACEIDNERLKVAKKMGADILLNSMNMENVKQSIKDLTDGRGADVVFCTVPSTKVAEQCIDLTGKLGRVIMYTSFHPDIPIEVSVNHIHSSEMVITGAVSPGNKDFLTATRLISSKIINLEGLITDVICANEVNEAYLKALEPSAYRIIVRFNELSNQGCINKDSSEMKIS